MLLPRGRDLSGLSPSALLSPLRLPPMRAAASSLARSALLSSHRSLPHLGPLSVPSLSFLSSSASLPLRPARSAASTAEAQLHLRDEGDSQGHIVEQAAERDMRSFATPEVVVRELEELPEQWRRARVAWLCKELPAHKPAGLIRILNAQRKWITQEDATYVTLHCARIRENEAAFRVYKWMVQQRWYCFDFALTTKLADYLGKDRKFTKCREMFDAIINQGRVPGESTFHILTIAYLSAPVQGCLEEACAIYNRMIQLGGYRPKLSLHNSLFRALVSKPGGSSKHHLKQAEFIYHNLVTTELEVHKDIYAGLIWLHSYQDLIDKERIATLREEMQGAGIEESRDVLVSIMRAFSKGGDVEETEKAWLKLLESGCGLPSQAFVYRMDLYSKIGEPMKSLEIFRGLKDQDIPASVTAYHKIIEVMAKAHEVEIVESLMEELIESGMKPLLPAFLDLMSMYSNLRLHDKLELAFFKCLSKCSPNRSVYNIYLESLAKIGKIEKAEEIFDKMHENSSIGVNARACNTILGGFLSIGEFVKAEKIYDIMNQKKYDIEPHYLEKLEYILSLSRKVVKRPVRMKLDKDQRETLTGLLLGGARIESDEERRNHVIYFEFTENSRVHSVFKSHIHQYFYEWLTSSSRSADGEDEIPYRFCTIAHSYFGFFADQFWLKGRPMIPKLIHRWLSPRVLAYWYMYGGLRLNSGDIVLRLNGGNRDDVERIAKIFHTKSLACRVKRKGRVYWIGFQGSNAVWFWKLTEPYIPQSVKGLLTPHSETTGNGSEEGLLNDFDSGSDSDEQSST